MKELQERTTNPFIYSTPDQIKEPDRALSLFVDVFKDFYSIESIGNTFMHGPRGSGKSMMFRIMKPDCQKIRLGKKLHELHYYAVYIPVKDTSLNIAELEYLTGKHGENIYNEHLMTVYFLLAIFKSLSGEDYKEYASASKEVLQFYNNGFIRHLKNSGYKTVVSPLADTTSISDIYNNIIHLLEDNLNTFSTYIQRLSIGIYNYDDALFLYRNFLLPIIKEITAFSFLPKNSLYLLIDDADLLSLSQTLILNSWVSYRSTSIMCFKITTQLNYKTWSTSTGINKIDSPHDYHEINLSDIYTANPKERYKDNVKQIVEKRLLEISGIQVSAEDFFLSNKNQEEAIDKIFKAFEQERGYDYAYRNARAKYMLGLSNEYSYSYAGFEQLVHLSSGIIRNFIDLSFKMFDETSKKNNSQQGITSIPVNIQDEEILNYANWLLLQLDKSIEDQHLHVIKKNNYRMLKNLINSLGKAFRLYIESNASEKRKFSFYFDGNVTEEVQNVLKLGVSEGILHYSTHGSKTGLGRSHKYVLNRMFSPIYKLDPFSFSGYLYLTPSNVELAIKSEKKFLEYIRERISANDEIDTQKQMEFDF